MLNIDGQLLKKMIISGANELELNRDYVDSLNVFPVPDGDTGTNMSLTVLSAAREIENVTSNDIGLVAQIASTGALKGARGNSGVILSQLFRGFAKSLENICVATNEDLALACMKAAEMAYKAVMKPKEGTILTMARELANKFSQEVIDNDDLEQILMFTIIYGKKVLADTTNMLPQLKQAGVVDSGARGLLFIIEGALKVLNNEIVFETEKNNVNSKAQLVFETDDIEFAYEVLMDIENADEKQLEVYKKFLLGVGDSLVISNDNQFTRIHVHTNQTGLVIEKALEIWPLLSVKLEDLKFQHGSIVNDSNEKCSQKKKIGFVVVSMGSGFCELFKNLGVDEVIEGGQTMNPSTKDILDAIDKVNADNVIVLPNNKNIILAAQQAMELCEDKNVFIVPSKTVVQGLSALLNFMPDDEIDINENIERMKDAIDSVKTGQITYAVRDSKFDDKKISQGDILCMLDNEIVLVEKNLEDAAKNLIDSMICDTANVLTIYFGMDTDESSANKIVEYARQNYPDLEVEVHNGNQPLYYYIISVE